MSGPVVHFEIPADDVARAADFYAQAFDWDVNAMPDMGYALLMTTPSTERGPKEPGAINGGMLARKEPVTAPVVVIQVDSIDDALKRVESLGGRTVSGREPVSTMGFAAYFTDSEGNVLGLWENAG